MSTQTAAPANNPAAAAQPARKPPKARTSLNSATVQAVPVADLPLTFQNWDEALDFFNKKFCYVRTTDVVVRLSDLEVFNPDRFVKRQYGNWFYKEINKDGEASYRPAVRKWLGSKQRNERDRMTFAPGEPRYYQGALNRWRQSGSQPKPGDVTPWNELLDFLFPDAAEQRKYFEQWLAYPLQHLGAKLKTAAVLYSRVQGIGKNILVEAVEKIYGNNAVEIGESQLHGDFNAWQKDRQFVVGDEVQGGGDKRKVIERLKTFITSPVVEINQKYQPQFSIPNVANFIFLSNNPDPFYIADEDRRFWAWEIPQDKALPDEFYRKFHDWKDSADGIAALHHHLRQVDTSDFNPDAKAPMTELKREMIEIGRTELERWLRDLPEQRPQQTLYTARGLLSFWRDENQLNKSKSLAGEAAVLQALKKLNFKQANGGKQVKVNGKPIRLWVVAKPEEAQRLLSMEPSELAEEYVDGASALNR